MGLVVRILGCCLFSYSGFKLSLGELGKIVEHAETHSIA